jgi:hypothetical protein
VVVPLLIFLQPDHPYLVAIPTALVVNFAVSAVVARIKERRDMDRGLQDAIRASQQGDRLLDRMP